MIALKRAKEQIEANERQRTEPIAVVGLACRFPGGANDLEGYWRLLDRGVDAVREIPTGRVPADPAFPQTVSSAALLDDVERFDAEFFGISAREAERLDPQQRLLLEVTWEALEVAGHAPSGLSGSRTGVYIGIGSPDYLRRILRCNPSEVDGQSFTGSLASVAAGRLAYILGLQGPCMAIDTACSSSLVALHQACMSLRNGESDLALAGGVNLILSPESSYVLGQLKALSPDGRCKTFDARANGYVRGEGCGMVVLKRLADAQRDGDHVWALVRGSAINQDGRSAGLTAPNLLAQQALLRQALRNARVEPEQIGYVETHGTGTPLGDPIEIEALTSVLGKPRADGSACVLGAVKTNIGHLEAAAGMAGLIKAILAFKHQSIPPNLHFRALNPRISLTGTPFVMSDGRQPWRAGGKPRFAEVSSFGISGTNAAVILEEPPVPSQAPASSDRTHHVLTLSARSPQALGHVVANVTKHLRTAEAPSLRDFCFTSRAGRAHFAYRAAFAASSAEQLQGMLDEWVASKGPDTVGASGGASHRPKIAFLFTGQGSQYAGMGRGLHRSEPVFRAALDRCAQLFAAELPRPLLEVMWRDDPAELDQTLYSQPALFSLEYALVALWRSWGIEPDVVLGHSLGEYAAANAAGVLSLEDACRLVAARARACQALGPGGAMAAVEAEPALVEAVVAELGGGLAIAAYNGPKNLSLSGPAELVRTATENLSRRGAKIKPINTSCAFHSPLMAPMVAPFAEHVARVAFSAPRTIWITNVTAERATSDFDAASYWSRQLCAPVRFAEGVQRARELGCEIWVEIGPNPVLLGAVSRSLEEPQVTAPSLHHGRDDDAVMARAAATLYEQGAKLDWHAFDAPFARRRVPLPTYPFERERYWFPLAPSPALLPQASAGTANPLLGERIKLPGSEIHFANRLSAAHPEELNEHRVYGQVVVPAALYVAAFLAAVREISGGAAIEDVAFTRALAIPEGTKAEGVPVAVVVTPGEPAARLSFFGEGTEPTAEWKLHASAMASLRQASASTAELQELRSRCRQTAAPEKVLASVWTDSSADRGPAPTMSLGPRFRRIAELWTGPSETLARLALSAPLEQAAGRSHPSDERWQVPVTILDSCFQLLGIAAFASEAHEAWMPIGVDRVELHPGAAHPGSEVWAHASAVLAGDGSLVRGNVRLLDSSGALLLTLSGVSLKRVSQAALLQPPAWRQWMYELAWRRLEPAPGVAANAVANRSFAIVLDHQGHGERFAREIEARGGAVTRFSGPQELERGPPLDATHVVSFSALDGGTPEEVTTRALALLQTASRLSWRRAPRIWWLTAGAQPVEGEQHPVSIAQASLWGLARCAALELPDLWGGLIDLDPRDGEGSVARLLEVLTGKEDQIAVRSGALFTARLEPLRRRGSVPTPLRLRDDATYLISGGLGGIGWPLVEAWIERGARHLVLLGRSAPSAEQQRRLADHAQRGVTLRVLGVDVTDGTALAARWAAVQTELPPLRGVVHAAGVLDDAALLRHSARHLGNVLAPKLLGGENLRQLTEGAPLDFFVLFSSLAGVLGSPGQASYAAANAGLDALAHELRGRGVPALSIAWGPWEVGFAAGHQETLSARGVAPLPAHLAIEALSECIALSKTHLVVTAADLRAVAAKVPERARAILEHWTATASEAPSPEVPSRTKAFVAELLSAPPQRKRNLVLDRVTAETRQLLGRAAHVRIDPTQSLFELGLDSLSAVQFRAALQRAFGRVLPASLAFEHPTLDALADALLALLEADNATAATAEPAAPTADSSGGDVALDAALHGLREGQLSLPSLSPSTLATMAEAVRTRLPELPVLAAEPIAIVGMGCRFPGGVGSPAELWDLLRHGVDAITEIPADRWDRDAWYDPDPEAPDKTPIRHGGFIDDVADFDAGFFRISPREARCMDPQHRLLLEVAWQALEDAGQDPQRLMGTNTGVFIGFMNNDYASHAELAEFEGHLATGNGISNAVGRLSFVLGVHGPSVALDTACSSSLVAIHSAVESLRKRECNLALAGGVSLILSPGLTVLMSKLGGLALDGHCKTFDASANGYVRSEGCGVLVLKRLSEAQRDRDRIVAVIRGSAVNHGGRSGGFSQPNARAQQALLREALARSQTLPHQVSYLEAHGTGTPLGDPIEYRAAAAVYSSGRDANAPLHIGSIKTNLGHAEAAAGVAGVMKVALALQARQIPPHLNLTQLSPEIDLDVVPARIPTALTAWEPIGGRRIAGVSGFGMSGINAHLVLEEALPSSSQAETSQATASTNGPPTPPRAELLALSAQSEAALRALAEAYQKHLGEDTATLPSLHDLVGTAGARRAHHEARLGLVAGELSEVRAGLSAFLRGQTGGRVVTGASEAGRRPRIVFVCPGQGSQWLGMGRELYANEPAFRDAIDQCERAMQPHAPWRLVERLHAPEAPAGIDVIQPLLFAISVALGTLWRAWGIEPDAVVGHSMGEVAAAHLAGALSLNDAARIICQRSRLMLEVAGRGAMAMVELGAQQLEPRLAPYGDALCVAASNSTRSSVVTGEAAAVEQLLAELATEHVFARRIKVDVASHGPQVDPLAGPLVECLEGLRPVAGTIPFWSSVTASLGDGAELGPEYWMRNLRQPVRFAETITGLLASEHALFVELSAHPILATAIEHTAEDGGSSAWVVGSLERNKPERAAMLHSLAELYARGYPVDFRRLYPGSAAVPLPTYPFQRQRYWVDQVKTTPLLLRNRPDLIGAAAPVPAQATTVVTTAPWAELLCDLTWEQAAPPSATERGRRYLIFSDRGNTAKLLVAALEASGHSCAVLPAEDSALDGASLDTLAAGRPFHGGIHLGCLDATTTADAEAIPAAEAQAGAIARALTALERYGSPPLWLVTRGGQSIDGEAPSLSQAAIWGLGRSLAAEHPSLRSALVDLDPALDPTLYPEAAKAGATHEVAELCRWLTTSHGEQQLALRGGQARVARLARTAEPTSDSPTLIHGDRTYWIAGGLAGLGGAVARELVSRGARHILVTGERDAASVERSSETVRALEEAGASVMLSKAPLSDPTAVSSMLTTLSPPLAAVIHAVPPAAAAAARTAPPSEDALRSAVTTLADEGWRLYEATRGHALDFAMLFGPAAVLLGGAGQTAAAVATEVSVALAARWRRETGPARAFLLASWPGAEEQSLEGIGISAVDARTVVEAALSSMTSSAAAPGQMIASIDWPLFRNVYAQRADERFFGHLGQPGREATTASLWRERLKGQPPETARKLLHDLVAGEAREVLGLSPEQPLSSRLPFTELGLDSVMALKLMTRLGRALGVRLATVLIFEHPTTAALTEHLASDVLQLPSQAAANDSADSEEDDLSEDELADLLMRKLGSHEGPG
ncbi:SDR family NAD(P)-dependent oxidoreductase [Stigmatella sp. ncwal1]|uniref:SDR family NAD(P)-dependent oxidoreductase n=1 Tax=Stigmatella ashevillensis TaxID=2995309 RepID=A0ABT5D4I1_9BACT|nr:type I polyketide synthase [Stigmatella ashevillena]MDC0708570.1 SDR family NAD(P)-dependent oxidoreductase [Stigmatella ashevillena]